MGTKKKRTKEAQPDLFIPPVGYFRDISENKREEYIKKYKSLGAFYYQEYDLDICTIYRQMDDLKSRYKDFAGAPFEKYVEQIKEGAKYFLEMQNLDADFYLNHFHYTLNHKDPAYKTYLGLFLALSNPLKIVPILEYQYNQFYIDEAGRAGAENFLNELEYIACNFIRTNRFPEDFFAKHDKIMNWVFAKRDFRRYENLIDDRISSLLEVLNKFMPKDIPKELVTKVNADRKNNNVIVSVVENMRDILCTDLKDYFSEENHEPLKKILSGEAPELLKITFLGHANQLIDVFRIYADTKNMNGDKSMVVKWICNHFVYYNELLEYPRNFDNDATKNMIYGQRLPTREKRIPLTGIHNRLTYYRK